MSETNEALIRGFIEIFNKRQIDKLGNFLANDFVWLGPAGEMVRGLPQARGMISNYWTAFPDMECSVGDLFSAGDRVVLRWNCHGTHRGTFMGVEPTERRVTLEGISIYQIKNGRIVEEWETTDLFGLFRQLGCYPSLEEVGAV